ncbi:hypothetical protein ACHAWO_000135 [Cyclotella atomus]|jgi:siroheme synthase|uniref:Tetrapyrrole methylase domain-containing protein n=1 Tax=Cyclotella atomus TaxID=382360 RepID=A0ABD3NRI6_9STRA
MLFRNLLLPSVCIFLTAVGVATAFACQSTHTLCNHDVVHRSSSALRASRQSGEDGREDPSELLRQSIKDLATLLDSTDGNLASYKSRPGCSSVVHIIGTGLTPSLTSLPLSTLHVLSQADVVLYDSLGLSFRDICHIVPRHCKVMCVGKRGDDAKSWKQTDIDQMLLEMALQQQTEDNQDHQTSRIIVRLKGGDPFLFGRTRSEIETLRANNITYTYSPAISSCIAGPHLGGIPLTDAELNCQSFGVWSGTDAFGRSYGLNDQGNEADFASGVDVLVFLMIGRLDKLEALCDLLAGKRGKNSVVGNDRKWHVDTPCAVIQNAGGVSSDVSLGSQTPVQKVWRSTLGNIVPMIRSEDEARVSVSPAVFVVGRVCELDLTCTTR